MSPSRVNNYHGNNQDDTSINHTTRTRPLHSHNHRHHQQPPHHYEALHSRGLLHQQALLSGIHGTRVVPPEGTPPPPWRPLPPLPWHGSVTDTETLSSSDVDSNLSYTEDPDSQFTPGGACSCYCHRRGLPPCYSCCERGTQEPSEGGTFSCSGESLYTLPYTIPYTCHTSKSSGNSTLDVRLPKNNSKVKFQPTVHTINRQLATENKDSDQFWWLANLEENLAWGVFVFHLGVIPFLLIYSGRSVYCFILPLFVIFCGWVVVRKCGRKVHPCQTLGKLILSTSCLMLAITMAELMNYHMPKETGAAIAISIVILTAFPMGYLICKKDEISC